MPFMRLHKWHQKNNDVDEEGARMQKRKARKTGQGGKTRQGRQEGKKSAKAGRQASAWMPYMRMRLHK